MAEVWKPERVEEVQNAVQDALSAKKTLELVGSASRRSLGRPVAADVVLDLSALAGIQLYEPEELILVVAPGTPLEEVRQTLAGQGQHLAFEPPDYGPLWGQAGNRGTIGGAIMTGRNGSRRLTAGAARDHVLGIKGVNGFGDPFVAGGRVVKNVTGFDLAKLLTGSYGTLCAATELTLKVLPRPPEAATMVLFGLTGEEAVAAMRESMNDVSAQVSSAAYLPADVAQLSDVVPIAERGDSATVIRIEGFGPSVTSGLSDLERILGDRAAHCTLDGDQTASLWEEITGAAFFAGNDRPLWFLSVPPAQGAVLAERLAGDPGGRCFLDWAGGAIWLETPQAADANAPAVRRVLRELLGEDGHATLIRASEEARTAVDPLHPLAPGADALHERVRRQFDPEGILNPGRMYEVRGDAN